MTGSVALLHLLLLFILYAYADSRGVLSIKLNEFHNPTGRTFDGGCCDVVHGTYEENSVCGDECDYVMRLIVSGLGRANDHVFLFHRPLKYNSNDVIFDQDDGNLVLTVLFDKWPLDDRVKMSAFFYDYDDFDHTTTLVDWFGADLKHQGHNTIEDSARGGDGVFHSQAIAGNRRQNKTKLGIDWSVLCSEGSDCIETSSNPNEPSPLNTTVMFDQFEQIHFGQQPRLSKELLPPIRKIGHAPTINPDNNISTGRVSSKLHMNTKWHDMTDAMHTSSPERISPFTRRVGNYFYADKIIKNNLPTLPVHAKTEEERKQKMTIPEVSQQTMGKESNNDNKVDNTLGKATSVFEEDRLEYLNIPNKDISTPVKGATYNFVFRKLTAAPVFTNPDYSTTGNGFDAERGRKIQWPLHNTLKRSGEILSSTPPHVTMLDYMLNSHQKPGNPILSDGPDRRVTESTIAIDDNEFIDDRRVTESTIAIDNEKFIDDRRVTESKTAIDNDEFIDNRRVTESTIAIDNDEFIDDRLVTESTIAIDNDEFIDDRRATESTIAIDNDEFIDDRRVTESTIALDNNEFIDDRRVTESTIAIDDDEFIDDRRVTESTIALDNNEFIDDRRVTESKTAIGNNVLIDDRHVTESMIAIDNNEFIDNRHVTESTIAIDSNEFIDDRRVTESTIAIDNNELIDDRRVKESTIAIGNNEFIDDRRVTESTIAIDNDEFIDDRRVTESTIAIDNDEFIDDRRVTESTIAIDNNEFIDDRRVTESTIAIDNNKFFDNRHVTESTIAIDDDEFIDDRRVTESTIAIDNDEFIDDRRVTESKTAIDSNELIDDRHVTESTIAIDNNEFIDNRHVTESTIAIDDDEFIDDRRVTESKTAIDSNEFIDDRHVTESTIAIDNNEFIDNRHVTESTIAIDNDEFIDDRRVTESTIATYNNGSFDERRLTKSAIVIDDNGPFGERHVTKPSTAIDDNASFGRSVNVGIAYNMFTGSQKEDTSNKDRTEFPTAAVFDDVTPKSSYGLNSFDSFPWGGEAGDEPGGEIKLSRTPSEISESKSGYVSKSLSAIFTHSPIKQPTEITINQVDTENHPKQQTTHFGDWKNQSVSVINEKVIPNIRTSKTLSREEGSDEIVRGTFSLKMSEKEHFSTHQNFRFPNMQTTESNLNSGRELELDANILSKTSGKMKTGYESPSHRDFMSIQKEDKWRKEKHDSISETETATNMNKKLLSTDENRNANILSQLKKQLMMSTSPVNSREDKAKHFEFQLNSHKSKYKQPEINRDLTDWLITPKSPTDERETLPNIDRAIKQFPFGLRTKLKRPNIIELMGKSIKRLKSVKFLTPAPVQWFVTGHPAFNHNRHIFSQIDRSTPKNNQHMFLNNAFGKKPSRVMSQKAYDESVDMSHESNVQSENKGSGLDMFDTENLENGIGSGLRKDVFTSTPPTISKTNPVDKTIHDITEDKDKEEDLEQFNENPSFPSRIIDTITENKDKEEDLEQYYDENTSFPSRIIDAITPKQLNWGGHSSSSIDRENSLYKTKTFDRLQESSVGFSTDEQNYDTAALASTDRPMRDNPNPVTTASYERRNPLISSYMSNLKSNAINTIRSNSEDVDKSTSENYHRVNLMSLLYTNYMVGTSGGPSSHARLGNDSQDEKVVKSIHGLALPDTRASSADRRHSLTAAAAATNKRIIDIPKPKTTNYDKYENTLVAGSKDNVRTKSNDIVSNFLNLTDLNKDTHENYNGEQITASLSNTNEYETNGKSYNHKVIVNALDEKQSTLKSIHAVNYVTSKPQPATVHKHDRHFNSKTSSFGGSETEPTVTYAEDNQTADMSSHQNSKSFDQTLPKNGKTTFIPEVTTNIQKTNLYTAVLGDTMNRPESINEGYRSSTVPLLMFPNIKPVPYIAKDSEYLISSDAYKKSKQSKQNETLHTINTTATTFITFNKLLELYINTQRSEVEDVTPSYSMQETSTTNIIKSSVGLFQGIRTVDNSNTIPDTEVYNTTNDVLMGNNSFSNTTYKENIGHDNTIVNSTHDKHQSLLKLLTTLERQETTGLSTHLPVFSSPLPRSTHSPTKEPTTTAMMSMTTLLSSIIRHNITSAHPSKANSIKGHSTKHETSHVTSNPVIHDWLHLDWQNTKAESTKNPAPKSTASPTGLYLSNSSMARKTNPTSEYSPLDTDPGQGVIKTWKDKQTNYSLTTHTSENTLDFKEDKNNENSLEDLSLLNMLSKFIDQEHVHNLNHPEKNESMDTVAQFHSSKRNKNESEIQENTEPSPGVTNYSNQNLSSSEQGAHTSDVTSQNRSSLESTSDIYEEDSFKFAKLSFFGHLDVFEETNRVENTTVLDISNGSRKQNFNDTKFINPLSNLQSLYELFNSTFRNHSTSDDNKTIINNSSTRQITNESGIPRVVGTSFVSAIIQLNEFISSLMNRLTSIPEYFQMGDNNVTEQETTSTAQNNTKSFEHIKETNIENDGIPSKDINPTTGSTTDNPLFTTTTTHPFDDTPIIDTYQANTDKLLVKLHPTENDTDDYDKELTIPTQSSTMSNTDDEKANPSQKETTSSQTPTVVTKSSSFEKSLVYTSQTFRFFAHVENTMRTLPEKGFILHTKLPPKKELNPATVILPDPKLERTSKIKYIQKLQPSQTFRFFAHVENTMRTLPEKGFILHTKLPPKKELNPATVILPDPKLERTSKIKYIQKLQPSQVDLNKFRNYLHQIRHGPKVEIPKEGLYNNHTEIESETESLGDLPVDIPGSMETLRKRRPVNVNLQAVFTRYWPAVLGVAVGTVFLLSALVTSVLCRQRRLLIQRRRWTDSPQHLSEPPDTSEYATSSAASLTSDLARSSINLV